MKIADLRLIVALNQLCMLNQWKRHMTGSRVIGGFTEESDWDMVVCVPPDAVHLVEEIMGPPSSPESYDPLFTCFRNGMVNVIVVHEDEFYSRWLAALYEAIQREAHTKEERIEIFRRYLYEQ